MRILPLRGVAALCVGTGLALGGCGGGDDGLTRAELGRQAGDVCERAERRLERLRPPADFQTNPRSAAKLLDQAIGITDSAVGDLRGLEAPEESREAWDDYVALQEKNIRALRSARDKAERGDESGLRDLQAVADDAPRLRRLARESGVPRCVGS